MGDSPVARKMKTSSWGKSELDGEFMEGIDLWVNCGKVRSA